MNIWNILMILIDFQFLGKLIEKNWKRIKGKILTGRNRFSYPSGGGWNS